MAIGLTLLLILAELLGPSTLFGPLTQYRIELILTLVVIAMTVPSVASSGIRRSPMLLFVAGMVAAVGCSIALSGWLGGVFYVGYGFLPVVMGFFVVAVNCRTKFHLQLVVLTLFLGCAFDVFMGWLAVVNDVDSPYVLMMYGNLPRIKGAQFIDDPNDFAQVMVALVPLMFFFWRKGGMLVNLFFVLPAVSVLLYGIYMTHSRGGLVALMATGIFAARRKVGLIPAAVAGGVSSWAHWR